MAESEDHGTTPAPRTLFSLGRPGAGNTEAADDDAAAPADEAPGDETPADEAPGAGGLPPSVAAMTAPAATLYADPSVVQPLPRVPERPWEVAEARVGTVADLEVEAEPGTEGRPAAPPYAGEATTAGPPAPPADAEAPLGAVAGPVPVPTPPATDAPPPDDPVDGGSRRGLLVALSLLGLVVLAGVVAVLVAGGGGDGDEVSSGDPEPVVTTGPPTDDGDDVLTTDADPAPDDPAPESSTPPASPETSAPPSTTAATVVPPTAPPAPAPPPPPTAVTVTVPVGSSGPGQLVVSPTPVEGGRLIVPRGRAGYLNIQNTGGTIGSFTITGGGLQANPAQGSVPVGALLTVNIVDTAGTDRVTYLDVRGSGFAQRYEVLVR